MIHDGPRMILWGRRQRCLKHHQIDVKECLDCIRNASEIFTVKAVVATSKASKEAATWRAETDGQLGRDAKQDDGTYRHSH
jgi:hypothetical protein